LLLLGTCNQQIDLCFVLDSSGSIVSIPEYQQNWQDVLSFVNGVIDEFTIGPNDVQVALVMFSDNAAVEFYFNAYNNAAQVKAKVLTLQNLFGSTNLAAGMNLVWQNVYTGNGVRSEASKITIIVTDGVDNVSTVKLRSPLPSAQKPQTMTFSGVLKHCL
jgi:hypothetical protein